MAFRVDNILISEKNVYLLDNGKQYVADIENVRSKNDENNGFSGNYWNVFDTDGVALSNLFDISSFNVRTQSLTTTTKSNPDDKDSHEMFFMPKADTVVGMCQLYDNAYSIGSTSKDKFKSEFTIDAIGGTSTYSAGYGFCQYQPLADFKDDVAVSISPEILYNPDNGVQYLTEYPINGFYSDFGDNTDCTDPTIYGDSVLTKYFLDYNYSVNAFADDNGGIRFSKMRTYSNIGTTGNSVYLVYKNDMIGRNENYKKLHESNFVNNKEYIDIDVFKTEFDINTLGYTGNIVTAVSVDDKRLYSSESFSTTFDIVKTLTDTYTREFQPKDQSFELYLVKGDTDGKIKGLQYIPKRGMTDSATYFSFNYGSEILEYEIEADLSIIETEHSVIIGTKLHGLIVVWGENYTYDTNRAYTDFQPFHLASLFTTDGDEKKSTYFGNFVLSYNGSDILCATCTYSDNRLAFFSVGYTDEELSITYEIGQKWRLAIATDDPTPKKGTEFVSSSSIKSEALFDYCPSAVEDVMIGNYVFVQFPGFGLRKAHVSELSHGRVMYYTTVEEGGKQVEKKIENSSAFAIFTSTGSVNKIDSSVAVCKSVHFSLNSYSGSLKTSALATLGYVGSGSTYITVKPSLKAVWKSNTGYSESFVVFPLNSNRDAVKEPTFTTTDSRNVEQFPINTFKFAMDKSIPYSMGVTVRNINANNARHDVSAALVKWNETSGKYDTSKSYENPDTSVGGLHLQYSAIVSDIMVQGSYGTYRNCCNTKWRSLGYTASVYEYPHPAYGDFVTEGTGLKIFDGELDDSMKVKDILFVNGHLVVKNYKTKPRGGSVTESEAIKESGKGLESIVPTYISGGYVVSNYFSNDNNIGELYSNELLESSSRTDNSNNNCKGHRHYIYTYYNNLWHIKPTRPIGFYPASNSNDEWKPYYAGKYVDRIEYHNGYYYIILRSSGTMTEDGRGYELVETDNLYTEKQTKSLGDGKYITDIRFLGEFVAVEYSHFNELGNLVKEPFKVFRQGYYSTRRSISIGLVNSSGSFTKDNTWFVQNGVNTTLVNGNALYNIPCNTTDNPIQSISEPYATKFIDVKAIDGRMMIGLGDANGVPSLHYSLISDSFVSSITPNDITSKLSSLTKFGTTSMLACDGALSERSVGNGLIVCLPNETPKNARIISKSIDGTTHFTYAEYGNFKVCTSYVVSGTSHCIVKDMTNGKFYISRDFPQYGNGYSCGEIFEPITTGFDDDSNVECFKVVRCEDGRTGSVVFTKIVNGKMSYSKLVDSSITETVSEVTIPSANALCEISKVVLNLTEDFEPSMFVQTRVIASADINCMILSKDKRLLIFDDKLQNPTPIATVDVDALDFVLPGLDSDGKNCYGVSVVLVDTSKTPNEKVFKRLIGTYELSARSIESGFNTYEIEKDEDGSPISISFYGSDKYCMSAVDYRNSDLYDGKKDYSSQNSYVSFASLKHVFEEEAEEGEEPVTYTVNYKVVKYAYTDNNFYICMESSRAGQSINSFGVVKAEMLTKITNSALTFEFSNYRDGDVSIFAMSGKLNSASIVNLMLFGSITAEDATSANIFVTDSDIVETNIREVSFNNAKTVKFIMNNVAFDSDVSETVLTVSKNMTNDACVKYDNVEMMYSLNRFTPSVCHKSNLFSIRIEDLGLDESTYLTDSQKDNIEHWFKNKITEIVDRVKPAHTQLFDIYMR